MKVGHIIKAERIRQEIKQVVLAKGICTPSYLSRIEQGLTLPSEEITALLLRKLGIDITKINRSNSQTDILFKKYLKDVYKEVIRKRDKDLTQQKLIELENQSSLFEDHLVYYTYLLISLRFHLILREELKECKKALDALNELKQNFSTIQIYLFKLNNALYYYSIKNTKKSIKFFEDTLSIVSKISLEEWEKAELNYMIGLAYIADNRIVISIDYIKKAMEYFKDNFLMKRVFDCYLLIGITYKKSNQYEEALATYRKVKQLCNEFDLHCQLGIVYHNIGTLNIAMGNKEEGLSYLHKALMYKDEGKSQLISMFTLVIEYSKEKKEELVIDWCNQGISLFLQLKDDSLVMFFHHFNFYKYFYEKNALSYKTALEAIEYFREIQDYRHAKKYCIAIAERFLDEKKYKLASIFFKESNRYSYLDKSIEKWEEL